MQRTVTISDQKISYRLVRRSGQRGIRLTIKQTGEIIVSAPKLLPIFAIEQFLSFKSSWLLAKIAYFNAIQKVQPIVKLTPMQINRLKVQTRQIITPKLTKYGQLLGVKWRRVAIKDQTSRWGSCSRQGNLNFNLRIAMLSDELADYIVVHELCHLRHFDHSAKFWALVQSVLPDYKKHVKYLRQHVMALS